MEEEPPQQTSRPVPELQSQASGNMKAQKAPAETAAGNMGTVHGGAWQKPPVVEHAASGQVKPDTKQSKRPMMRL